MRMIASGTLGEVFLSAEADYPAPDPEQSHLELTADQASVAAGLVDNMRNVGHGVSLIDGVTGAGKTEVYFEAIAEALRTGKQVAVLLPRTDPLRMNSTVTQCVTLFDATAMTSRSFAMPRLIICSASIFLIRAIWSRNLPASS